MLKTEIVTAGNSQMVRFAVLEFSIFSIMSYNTLNAAKGACGAGMAQHS